MHLVNRALYHLLALALMAIPITTVAKQYQVEHLEPLSWWTGMQSKQLQLMVHGKDIAQLTPKFATENIRVMQVHSAQNPNYLFIDLVLSDKLQPGSYPLDFYQGNDKVLTVNYQFNARNQHSAATQSFSPKDVIYLVTPDRFANGDSSNDHHPQLIEGLNRAAKGGRHGGDIQGMIDHLDYISDMGFTQIWTNPMIENNQGDHSYHGYSATDFYQIDARFGSNELYRSLSQQARQKDIGLIKDVVLNHIGSNHWWMQDLPMADWLNFQGAVSQPEAFVGTHHKRESLHDPHASKQDKTLFADGWFVPSMPDLNQRNSFVSTYLIQNTLWWIEYANLAGIRVDTYSYSDREFLTRWTKRITQEYPSINIVGEEWATNPAIVSYWQRGKVNHDGYQSYLPSVIDFPLQQALVQALTNADSWNSGLNQLYQLLANDFQYADPYNLVTFADNHDMSRIFTQLNEDVELYKMAISILLTTRGIPQIFYGTEIAMANPGTDDHGIIRADMPGGWPTDQRSVFKQQGLTPVQNELLNFTKTLLNWRKTASAVHNGKLLHYAPQNGIYAYGRLLAEHESGDNLLVVVNKSDNAVNIKASDYSEISKNGRKFIDIFSRDSYQPDDAIKINKRSVMILTITK